MANLIYSEQHSWQDDKAVQQILVFLDQNDRDFFDVNFKERVEQYGIEDASDTNIGAIVKLHAVMCNNGKWVSIIRSGVNGSLLHEHCTQFNTANKALKQARKFLEENMYLVDVFGW